MVKGFEKNSCATQVLKKLFNTYLNWTFSWFLNLDFDSWNLNLETWFLILEIKFPFEPWSVLDSILNSFFDSWDHHLCYHELFLIFALYVITFVIIKTSLNQSWFIMKLASTTPIKNSTLILMQVPSSLKDEFLNDDSN